MAFKKFLTSIIKHLIVLLVATLVFSSVTFDLPNLMKGVFGDIFEYASPDAQKQTVSKLAETCSSLGQENVVTMNQICTNESLLDSMKENCADYRELKRRNIKIENEAEARETCEQIESGELERSCGEIKEKGVLLPDFSNIGTLCKDYSNGRINDKEFFLGVVSSAIPSQQMQTNQISVLQRYSQIINYLNSNKLLYFVILAVLLSILYLLIMNVKSFLIILTQISLSIGIFIMLPYLAIAAYDKIIGINTTSILGIMFGTISGFDFKAIISVVLLLFLRTYNSLIITLGIIFLVVGIAGKVYGIVLKKETKIGDKKEEIEEAPKKTKKRKKS